MNCKITLFQDPHTRYTVGSEISGTIDYELTTDVHVQDISIRLLCTEFNSWIEQRLEGDAVSTMQSARYDSADDNVESIFEYSGKNTVYYQEKSLYYAANEDAVICAGSYIYNFRLVIPHGLPSSYKGPYGEVRYELHAVMHYGGRLKERKTILVFSPDPYDDIPDDYKKPIVVGGEKVFMQFAHRAIRIEVQLPKTVFTLGEVIRFQVFVKDRAKGRVKLLKVSLKKFTTYKVLHPRYNTKSTMEKLFSFKRSDDDYNNSMFDVTFTVPLRLDIPNFRGCQLFEVKYILQLKLIVEWFWLQCCSVTLPLEIDVQLAHPESFRFEEPLRIGSLGSLGGLLNWFGGGGLYEVNN